MSIPLPNLDDRTFSDLVQQMRMLIPRYAPGWTDHNVSDPGIMLIELFAWLVEALIYRLDRIPEASQMRMLELLGATFQPAQPAMVSLAVEASWLVEPSAGGQGVPAAGNSRQVWILPRGTPLVASVEEGDTALPFETTHALDLRPEQPGGIVQARQTSFVEGERLGVSDGQAHQSFRLARSFLAGEPGGQPMISRLVVEGQPWTYRPDLLDLVGEQFTVEPRPGLVRFGDGAHGRIPPPGAEIRASYWYTHGKAGNVSARWRFTIDEGSTRLSEPVREALEAHIVFRFTPQADAGGGTDPTGLDEARHEVTRALRARWRAVTGRDFEQMILERADLDLARARCVPERDLTAPDPLAPRPGHVSLIVVPNHLVDKPEPSPECVDLVWRFLDERRLIGCRHHVVGPAYTGVRVRADVVHRPKVSAIELLDEIEANLRGFFDPLTGGPEQQGWPFGRDVYASEVYQVIENTEGVDHVRSLALYTPRNGGDWRDAGDQVEIATNSLVHFVFQPDDIQVRAVG